MMARVILALVMLSTMTLLWADAQTPSRTKEQLAKLAERDRLEKSLKGLVDQKKHAELIAAVQRIAELGREVLGEADPQVASNFRRLANFHEALGQFAEAGKVRREVLRMQEARLGKGHWGVTDARIALTDTERLSKMTAQQRGNLRLALRWNQQTIQLEGMGKAKEALSLSVKVRDICEEILGKKHPHYAASLGNLAVLYENMGEHAKALPLLKEALIIREEALGKKHPSYATSLSNLAGVHRRMGENAEALTLYKEALLIREETLGKKHSDYANSLNHLATLYGSMGDNAKALTLAKEALLITEETKGKKHPDYATCLSHLAGLYGRLEENAKALPLLTEALLIREKTLGKKHPHYATCLSNLATLYVRMGENAKALPLIKEALLITEETLGKRHPHYATCLNTLANLYESMGEDSRALPLHKEALLTTRETLGKKHPDYATCLNNLAALYGSKGENAKALPLLKEALLVREEALGKKHPDYATSLNNLAVVYGRMGENAKALPLHKEALLILEETLGKKHSDYAACLVYLAWLYGRMGENAKALPLLKETLLITEETLGKKHPHYATSLSHLAGMYRRMGEKAKALPLLKEALLITEEALGKKHPHHATSLSHLAVLYGSMGENAKALPLLKEALLITEETLGKKHFDYAASLVYLAWLYGRMGENAKALPLLKEALLITEQTLGKKHHDYATCLNILAMQYLSMSKAEEAEEASAQALAVLGRHLDDSFDLLGERQRNQAVQHVLHHLGLLLSVQDLAEVPAAHRYAAVLAWKGRVAAHSALDRLAADRPELKQPLDKLQAARTRLARLTRQTPAPAQQPAWMRDVRNLTEEKEALEADLAKGSAQFRNHAQRRNLTPELLANQLPDGVAFVDVLEYSHARLPKDAKGEIEWEQRLLAFVSHRGKEVTLVPLGAAKPASDAVARWRAEVEKDSSQSDRKALSEAAAQLRVRVWDKVAKHIGNARTVVLAPDGALCQFPLGALPGTIPGTFLIEDLAIAQIASGVQLFELLRPAEMDSKVGKGLLAAGGIDYGSGQTYDPLPGTGIEARRCRDLFAKTFASEPTTLLAGKEATLAALRKEMAKRPRFLHLATHGYFEPTEKALRELKGLASTQRDRFALQLDRDTMSNLPGLRCGLALASANAAPPADDPDALPNVLTGHDLEAIDLRGCDVAVLSACQTALGDVQRSQGVVGLQSAFHAAGVRTTVTSLWSVQDAATAELMEEFYNNLWGKRKMTRLEALRQAQLAILRDPERVRKRSQSILADAAKRGLDNAALLRIKGRVPIDLPNGGKREPDKTPTTSPEAWWAAFVLSGDWR